MLITRKFLIPFLYSVLVAYFIISANLVSYGVAACLLFLPLFLINGSVYFSLFILIRPIVDLWGKESAGGLNLASLFTISLIFICGKELILNSDNWAKIKQNEFLKRFNLIFLSFLAIGFFSIFFSERKVASATDFFRLVSVLAAFNYSMAQYDSQIKLRGLLRLFLASSIVPLAFGLFQYLTGGGHFQDGLSRVRGTFGHSNVFSEYLLLVFFLTLFYLTNFRHDKTKRFVLIGFLCLVLFEIVNTYTRTVWIALAIAFCVYILQKKNFTKMAVYFLVSAAVVALVYSQIQKRFSDLNQTQESRNSLEWRKELWLSLIRDVKENPWTGHGLGMFEVDIGVMAHNDFLRLSYETGVPGAVSLLALFLYMLFHCFMRAKNAVFPRERERYSLCFCLVLALLICSMAVNTLRSTVILFYYLVIMGAFMLHQKYFWEFDEDIDGE